MQISIFALHIFWITVVTLLTVLEAPAQAEDARPQDPPTSAAVGSKATGFFVEFCSCERVCEMALGGGKQRCSIALGFHVEAGQRGDVPLAGRSAVLLSPDRETLDASPPGAVVLYVDAGASQAQAEALRGVLSERLGAVLGIGPLPKPKGAAVTVHRTNEQVSIRVEGAVDLRARPIFGNYRRPLMLENAFTPVMSFPLVGRGTNGQILDPISRIRFDAENRSVLYGKFDFGGSKGKRPTS